MAERKRRHAEEEHENHERWLVSYADFITLLFAFFVVMYSISAINEGKYRVFSDSVVEAFRKPGANLVAPVMVVQGTPGKIPMDAVIKNSQVESQNRENRESLKKMAEEVEEVLEPLVKAGKVKVTVTSRGILIEMSDSILFSPGQAILAPVAVLAMRSVASVVAPGQFPITIEGHTDNIPIHNTLFPSNWELSAVRATTVLRIFVDSGVTADRLTAIGYGDQRPLDGNDTPEGRARNRRVNILIGPDTQPVSANSKVQNGE